MPISPSALPDASNLKIEDPALAHCHDLAEAASFHQGHHVLSPKQRCTLLIATPMFLRELAVHRSLMVHHPLSIHSNLAAIAELSAASVDALGGRR